MKLHRFWVTALLALAATLTTQVAAGTPAHADTVVCEQFGSSVQGRYIVQNNRWGSTARQCVNATGGGFQITEQQGSVPANGAPLSYPSIFAGCHYTQCSPDTSLPKQVSTIGRVDSSITYHYTPGIFNASYDIWLDPAPKKDGVNQMEIMIWFNRQGPIQPIGTQRGTTTIGGRSWEVWQGNNGGNDVVSYVAPSPITSWSFNVKDFLDDVDARTQVTSAWYLTSIQAGFEPWQGGTGLAVSNFSANVTEGGGTAKSVKGQQSGRCLDVAGFGTADGTAVQLWDCWGTWNQLWDRTGSQLVNPQSGKCLDVNGGSTANGAKVQLWTCNGTGAQGWQVNANGTITNPQSGKCLDAGGSWNGAQLQIWDCYGGGGTQPNQVWSLS